MLDVHAASVALLAAAAVHLGFQLTVTLVVYPTLAFSPDWDRAHSAHTRSITPVVVIVYGALVLATGWALLATWIDPWTLLAAAGAGLALLSTALVAGPTHGRLADGRDPALLRRLLVADRVRTVGAVVFFVGAALGVLR
ncbi:MAG: hypothetical protein AVDCRST_MAG47-791 [uncultured Nocardioidaceae bacterium]|uniref:DUF1772 domain-containing protein n=1 Tax=uncultured Nocardioidaceae bacterium TaxID=253824 RepID=A0A6J4MYE7_9ACTN|nr:MAG: hypothetical protein AVDCRST_MAG47-791 [uncultured Nocardioidaceae bacterium]